MYVVYGKNLLGLYSTSIESIRLMNKYFMVDKDESKRELRVSDPPFLNILMVKPSKARYLIKFFFSINSQLY